VHCIFYIRVLLGVGVKLCDMGIKVPNPDEKSSISYYEVELALRSLDVHPVTMAQ